MRLVHSAAVAVAALLLASAASAQGLGAAAAREREKRKTQPDKPAKVYTEDDIGRSMAPVSSNTDLPATADDADAEKKPDGEGGAAAAGEKDPETVAAEARAKAEADWRKRLEQARQEEASYTELVTRVQLALNDTSNLYNPGRQANVTLLEDTQKKLADVKTRIADLEAEGRQNNYR